VGVRARPRAAAYAALAGACFVVAGCGHSSRQADTATTATGPGVTTTAPSTTATTATTTPSRQVAIRIYLVRDGRVTPVQRFVPGAPAIGQAALDALASGPTEGESRSGLSSALGSLRPAGLTIKDGEADLGDLTHVSQLAEAQIVYTLTQFATVRKVRIGDDVLDRADLEDATPVILIESPLPGETVTSPITVTGTSNTFEATMRVEIRRGSQVLTGETVTATSGSGQRGTFSATLDVDAAPGPITLVAFEPSAENGRPIHTVTVPLTLG
jgi:Immunoglobulin-like domain of bacterial spore germination/Sporulation and spore germination